MARLFALCVAVAGVAGVADAGEFGCASCRSCGGSCVLRVEQIDEEESCYEVACEEVCIPAVRFPWRCRTPKCGRVRVVARLKEKSRPTRVCKYEWVVACPRCGRAEGVTGLAAEGRLAAWK